MTSALRWAVMRAILMFHNCEGQSHKTMSTDHNFWRERRAEAVSNRGLSAYYLNSLSYLYWAHSECFMYLCKVGFRYINVFPSNIIAINIRLSDGVHPGWLCRYTAAMLYWIFFTNRVKATRSCRLSHAAQALLLLKRSGPSFPLCICNRVYCVCSGPWPFNLFFPVLSPFRLSFMAPII